MNILPMNKEEAKKKHWVVRYLRIFALLICVFTILTGAEIGYHYSGILFEGAITATELIICVALGGLIGLLAGQIVSLPYWAIALMLDDLHAMRKYMEGFVVIGDERRRQD